MKRVPAKPIQLTAEQIQVIESAVFAAVEPILPEKFYLLDVTLEKEAGFWYLRIYVEEKLQGIALSDCETISRLLDPMIDALPELQDLTYSLEVSSPGLFRPLRRQREFEFFLNQPVRIEDRPPSTKGKKTVVPIAKSKVEEGLMAGYDLEKSLVTLKDPVTQQTRNVPLDDSKIICLNPAIRFPEDETEDKPLQGNTPELTPVQ